MTLSNGRIFLDAESSAVQQAALDVVMIGHCPGGAHLDFLLNSPKTVADIEALGYYDELRLLRSSPLPYAPLFGLPIPIASMAQFSRIFPRAHTATHYKSKLAFAHAWLPKAVEDFFQHGTGDTTVKKLWVICVDETAGQDAFLPRDLDNWLDPKSASPFARALMIPRAGLLAMPDLERLQIPAQLDDIPRLRLANPPPTFLPCSQEYDDTHRERRSSNEIPRQANPRGFGELLAPIVRAIAQRRPDIHVLLSLPFDPEQTAEQLQPASAALDDIATLQNSQLSQDLHRIQIIYPYLRDAKYAMSSSVGLLAGQMVTRTSNLGAWRSVAGIPLANTYQAYPLIHQQHARHLRDEHDIGVILAYRDTIALEDERILGGVFGESSEYAKSGEIARFIGWLRRELEAWGTQLLFDVDPNDPRPSIALRDFFMRLYRRGALRGRIPEEAFTIQQQSSNDNTLIFDIEIAPAFPIDRIRLNLTQERMEISNV